MRKLSSSPHRDLFLETMAVLRSVPDSEGTRVIGVRRFFVRDPDGDVINLGRLRWLVPGMSCAQPWKR
jgi:hypothetical protein